MGTGLVGVIVVLAVAGAIVAVAVRRRRGGKEPVAPEVPVPTVEVVALGISGAGKTVFLAGLFHELHVPIDDRPYFLRTEAADRVRLSGVLRQVSDARQPWPAGTAVAQTRKYTFDCMARAMDEWVPVLRVRYLDYAGEVLEEALGDDGAALRELESEVDRADAVLGMLDGRQILRYLVGDPGGTAYLVAAIQPMIGMMVAGRSPIYLVLTKWDIVRGFGEPADADDNARLELVRHALFALPQLQGLVDVRNIVRLIPVSAVGPDFARFDPESGRIDKRQDGRFRPQHVEVPLAAVVPDLLKRFQQAFDRDAGASVNSQLRRVMRLSPGEWGGAVAEVLTKPASAALGAVIGRPFSTELVTFAMEWLSKPYRDKGEQVAAFRTEAQRRLAAVADARAVVVEHFQKTMYVFEAKLPASRL
ncbi:hypothetical protein ABZS66_30135 [Dactylosporangium sp. NPDC005572]|uniref:hypothetical protein n=1 Tax=Dactylosporangium sp. NPDC005572 TaxID=3156889 RepID=UPI0033A004F8